MPLIRNKSFNFVEDIVDLFSDDSGLLFFFGTFFAKMQQPRLNL